MTSTSFAAWSVFADLLDPPENPYVRDPVGWVRDRLGEALWSKQREILEAVVRHRYVAVKSAHDTGKSHGASRAVAWWLDTREDPFATTCFTDDTEILTKEGWKLFQDVKVGPDGDLFATRNQFSQEFEWQSAYYFHEADWDGEVIDCVGKSLHLRVTPNHRMLTKWRDHGARTTGEILKPAEKIGERGAELPALSKWKGTSPNSVRFGRYEWDSVTFASFLGAWMAEGSLGAVQKYKRKSNRG